MKEAKVNGKLVVAAPDAPETAVCPGCGGEVERRRVTRMDGTVTYSYRHARGQGKDCRRRYHPTRWALARKRESGYTSQ